MYIKANTTTKSRKKFISTPKNKTENDAFKYLQNKKQNKPRYQQYYIKNWR